MNNTVFFLNKSIRNVYICSEIAADNGYVTGNGSGYAAAFIGIKAGVKDKNFAITSDIAINGMAVKVDNGCRIKFEIYFLTFGTCFTDIIEKDDCCFAGKFLCFKIIGKVKFILNFGSCYVNKGCFKSLGGVCKVCANISRNIRVGLIFVNHSKHGFIRRNIHTKKCYESIDIIFACCREIHTEFSAHLGYFCSADCFFDEFVIFICTGKIFVNTKFCKGVVESIYGDVIVFSDNFDVIPKEFICDPGIDFIDIILINGIGCEKCGKIYLVNFFRKVKSNIKTVFISCSHARIADFCSFKSHIRSDFFKAFCNSCKFCGKTGEIKFKNNIFLYKVSCAAAEVHDGSNKETFAVFSKLDKSFAGESFVISVIYICHKCINKSLEYDFGVALCAFTKKSFFVKCNIGITGFNNSCCKAHKTFFVCINFCFKTGNISLSVFYNFPIAEFAFKFFVSNIESFTGNCISKNTVAFVGKESSKLFRYERISCFGNDFSVDGVFITITCGSFRKFNCKAVNSNSSVFFACNSYNIFFSSVSIGDCYLGIENIIFKFGNFFTINGSFIILNVFDSCKRSVKFAFKVSNVICIDGGSAVNNVTFDGDCFFSGNFDFYKDESLGFIGCKKSFGKEIRRTCCYGRACIFCSNCFYKFFKSSCIGGIDFIVIRLFKISNVRSKIIYDFIENFDI